MEAIVAPRGMEPIFGKQPLLCIQPHGACKPVYVIGVSARKNPFLAEFLECTGPDALPEPPFDVVQRVRQHGGQQVFAFLTEQELARGLLLARFA